MTQREKRVTVRALEGACVLGVFIPVFLQIPEGGALWAVKMAAVKSVAVASAYGMKRLHDWAKSETEDTDYYDEDDDEQEDYWQ